MKIIDKIWPKCYNCEKRHWTFRPHCTEIGGNNFSWKEKQGS